MGDFSGVESVDAAGSIYGLMDIVAYESLPRNFEHSLLHYVVYQCFEGTALFSRCRTAELQVKDVLCMDCMSSIH
jgi:hypothetical protein